MGGVSACGFVSAPRQIRTPPCFAEHQKGTPCIACSWDGVGTCDKCDGHHTKENCPYFRKDRDQHRDAWQHCTNGKKGGKTPTQNVERAALQGPTVLHNPRVICQPGDGSCLFHSLAFGLGEGASASSLRREIAMFIMKNPSLEIADTPLRQWVAWDSSMPVPIYAASMAVGGWGGGIEMAACARLKGVDIRVYAASGGAWRLISEFLGRSDSETEQNQAKRTVLVAYQGGIHYDAIVA